MEPTLTPTPTETPTETPIALPTYYEPGVLVYTVVAPGAEDGTEVVFRYEINAGDVVVSILLFGIFLVLILQMLLRMFMRSQA